MWYREHVAAEPTQAAALYDPRWLERPDGSYILSVLTNLPDDAPVIFDVFGNDQPLPRTSPFADLLNRWSDPLTTASVGGVATTTWSPPTDVTPGADDSPVPVFRTSTPSQDAHLWATWSDPHPRVLRTATRDSRLGLREGAVPRRPPSTRPKSGWGVQWPRYSKRVARDARRAGQVQDSRVLPLRSLNRPEPRNGG